MNLKYIIKFDYSKSKGYQARVPKFKGKEIVPYSIDVFSKFFRKSLYKNWEDCLKDAVAFRDQYLKEHDAMHLLNKHNGSKEFPFVKSRNNTSGVIGITITASHKPSGTYYGYAAYWNVKSEQYRKTFSWNHYGIESAFHKACKVRFDHAGTLIVTKPDLIPGIPKQQYKLEYE